MNTSDYDKQIEELRLNLNEKINEMETTRLYFIEAAKTFIAEWVTREVERTVTTKHEITQKHGTDGIRYLKEDLTKLTTNIPFFVEKHFNNKELWPHYDTAIRAYDFQETLKYDRTTNKAIDNTLRLILGYSGELLEKYGYVQIPQYSRSVEYWERDPVSTHLKYACGISYSENMKKILTKYSNLYKDFCDMNNQLDKLITQKNEHIAATLWNEA
jgi:hypothetical protein